MSEQVEEYVAIPVDLFDAAIDAFNASMSSGTMPNRERVEVMLTGLINRFPGMSKEEMRSAAIRSSRYERILMSKSAELVALGAARQDRDYLRTHPVCRLAFASMHFAVDENDVTLADRFVDTVREMLDRMPRVSGRSGVPAIDGHPNHGEITAVANKVSDGIEPIVEAALEPLESGACSEHAAPIILGTIMALSGQLGDLIAIGALHGMNPMALLSMLRETALSAIEDQSNAHAEHCPDPECMAMLRGARASTELTIADPNQNPQPH